MEKDEIKTNKEGGEQVYSLTSAVRKGLTEKVTFECRSEGAEGKPCTDLRMSRQGEQQGKALRRNVQGGE